MSDARERIRQKILADIKKRVDTYWLESQKNDAGFSDTAKAAKEEIHKWAAIDLNFLYKEYEKQHVENTRLLAELEAAKEMIGRACVWLDLHRKEGIDDVLRVLSEFLHATENGGGGMSEVRLIDAKRLVADKAYDTDAGGYVVNVDDIHAAPTIDPVRHGRWRAWSGGHPIWLGCFCSVCENCADSNFAFCPNCGARMDGEEEKDG